MIKLTRELKDPSGIVEKLVFEESTNFSIAETVVYKYKDRGVVCFSVQSGCPVGCHFCGTGKNFIRNLTWEEIALQIHAGYSKIKDCKKKQFMSMSMGEPMLNFANLMEGAEVAVLDKDPEAHFYISTVGIRRPYLLAELLHDGKYYKHLGLQFSLHHWHEETRRKMLGNYEDLMSIEEIKYYAKLWSAYTGKPAYFNYICTGKETAKDAFEVAEIVRGNHLTCSVICNTKDFAKGDPAPAITFADRVMNQKNAYELNVSIFDPAGQDTIGGGCGQLLYVQEKLKCGG